MCRRRRRRQASSRFRLRGEAAAAANNRLVQTIVACARAFSCSSAIESDRRDYESRGGIGDETTDREGIGDDAESGRARHHTTATAMSADDDENLASTQRFERLVQDKLDVSTSDNGLYVCKFHISLLKQLTKNCGYFECTNGKSTDKFFIF